MSARDSNSAQIGVCIVLTVVCSLITNCAFAATKTEIANEFLQKAQERRKFIVDRENGAASILDKRISDVSKTLDGLSTQNFSPEMSEWIVSTSLGFMNSDWKPSSSDAGPLNQFRSFNTELSKALTAVNKDEAAVLKKRIDLAERSANFHKMLYGYVEGKMRDYRSVKLSMESGNIMSFEGYYTTKGVMYYHLPDLMREQGSYEIASKRHQKLAEGMFLLSCERSIGLVEKAVAHGISDLSSGFYDLQRPVSSLSFYDFDSSFANYSTDFKSAIHNEAGAVTINLNKLDRLIAFISSSSPDSIAFRQNSEKSKKLSLSWNEG